MTWILSGLLEARSSELKRREGTGENVSLTDFPSHNGQVLGRKRPRERVLKRLQLLQSHAQSTLFDFVAGKDAQMTGQPDQRASGDKPLRRVVLVPPKGVTIVHRELVVEIVVAFSHGEEGGKQVVARTQFVVVRCASKPVRN